MYSFVTFHYIHKIKKLVRNNQDLKADISDHVGEKFGGIQTIKSYCAEEIETKKYMKGNLSSYEVAKKKIFSEGIQNSYTSFYLHLELFKCYFTQVPAF